MSGKYELLAKTMMNTHRFDVLTKQMINLMNADITIPPYVCVMCGKFINRHRITPDEQLMIVCGDCRRPTI